MADETIFEEYDSFSIAIRCGTRKMTMHQLEEVVYAWKYLENAAANPNKYFHWEATVAKALERASLIRSVSEFLAPIHAPEESPKSVARRLVNLLWELPTLKTIPYQYLASEFEPFRVFTPEHIAYAAMFSGKSIHETRRIFKYWQKIMALAPLDIEDAKYKEFKKNAKHLLADATHKDVYWVSRVLSSPRAHALFLLIEVGLMEEPPSHTQVPNDKEKEEA